MSQPWVSIELPADYWAAMAVKSEILRVVQVVIEKQLREQGYGHLVDQKREERLAELKASIDATMPGTTEKIESAINQVFGRRTSGH